MSRQTRRVIFASSSSARRSVPPNRLLEEPCLARAARLRTSEVAVGALGRHPALRGPGEKALLDEIRLVDVLDRVALLPDGRRERVETDRPAAELVDDREE